MEERNSLLTYHTLDRKMSAEHQNSAEVDNR